MISVVLAPRSIQSKKVYHFFIIYTFKICQIYSRSVIHSDEVPSKKPITVADQIAVDSNGRRRFHGAFTGGFSAGFWNTVGSKEGWKPQAFKSSRAEKSSRVLQNPEDFMDEEDTSEFGIAPQRIQTTDDFTPATDDVDDGSTGRKRKFQTDSQGPIPGTPVLHSVLESCRDPVPVSLLKKMGWRGKQKTVRKQVSSPSTSTAIEDVPSDELTDKRVYVCDMGPIKRPASSDQEDDDSDIDSDIEVNFEPDDLEAFIVNVKTDRFGIDYKGLDRSIFGGKSTTSDSGEQKLKHFSLFPTFEVLNKDNKKLSIKGQAFGVGAFEEDDDDIYAKEDMVNYDFSMEDKPKNPKTAKKKNAGELTQWSLEGFHAVDNLNKAMNRLFRIDLPRSFEPKNWLQRKSRFSPMIAQSYPSYGSTGAAKVVGRHDLTPGERGDQLNDEPDLHRLALVQQALEKKSNPPHTSTHSTTSTVIMPKVAEKPIDIVDRIEDVVSKAKIPFISDR